MSKDQEPQRRRRGDPSPTDPSLVFLGYHTNGSEYWGTPEQLRLLRERQKEHSKKENTKPRRRKWRKKWAKLPKTIEAINKQKKDEKWLLLDRAKNASYMKSRRAKDINFRLAGNIRVRMRSALDRCGARKAANTEALIGCSIDAFRIHIKSKFKPGMTFENRSEWHLDHVLPLSMFDLSNPEQQKLAFHYKNCVPEWKHDNLVKNDAIPGELLRGRHYRLKIIQFPAAA